MPSLYLNSADIQCLLGNDQDSLRKSGALFILKMKEQRRMTQVAVDDIVEGYKSLFSSTVQCLKARVRAKLADEGLTSTLCDDVFEDAIFPFNGIETAHLQEKYFQELIGIIVSYSIISIYHNNYLQLYFIFVMIGTCQNQDWNSNLLPTVFWIQTNNGRKV